MECLNILRVVYNKHCCNDFVCPISTSILSTLTSFKAGTIVISGVMVKGIFLEDPLPEISLQHLHS
jgi:hypothetical protein